MAITFTKELSQENYLHAYNNNVVSFYSNSSEKAVKATISIGGKSVTITPDPQGIFYYNFLQVFKLLVNRNYFRDDVVSNFAPDAVISNGLKPTDEYAMPIDSNVFQQTTAVFTIIFSNGSQESTTRSYKILRSLLQLEDYRRGLSNELNTLFSLLLPLPIDSRRTYYATMFDGYPFDIPLYSNAPRTLYLKNVVTGFEASVDVRAGVNRFALQDGQDTVTLENRFPLHLGINKIEISTQSPGLSAPEGESPITLFLEKKEASCGVYLKWFNQVGGWSYYLFNKLQENRSKKDLPQAVTNSDNLEDTRDLIVSFGASTSDRYRVFTEKVDLNQKRAIDTIVGSPKIYRYIEVPFQRQTLNSWVSDRLNTNSYELSSWKTKFYAIGFELTKPPKITMSI